jgi:hypothetical protein
VTVADLDLDVIETTAEAATEGEWIAVQNHEAAQCEVWSASEEAYIALTGSLDDMLHIASMSPATTLVLIAEVRRLRATAERVGSLADKLARDGDELLTAEANSPVPSAAMVGIARTKSDIADLIRDALNGEA